MTSIEKFSNFKIYQNFVLISKISYKVWEKVYPRCDRYYKVRMNLLQSVTGIVKCGKRLFQSVWKILQSVTIIPKRDVTRCNWIKVRNQLICNVNEYK